MYNMDVITVQNEAKCHNTHIAVWYDDDDMPTCMCDFKRAFKTKDNNWLVIVNNDETCTYISMNKVRAFTVTGPSVLRKFTDYPSGIDIENLDNLVFPSKKEEQGTL